MIKIMVDNADESLYQYDINRSLTISGLETRSESPEIHFTNYNMDSVIAKSATKIDGGDITARIPNELLVNRSPITFYVYDPLAESEKTIYSDQLSIIPRPKPADYILPDDEDAVTTYKKLVVEIETLKSDKLGKDELSGAVDEALAKAKESGDFNGKAGEPGYTPVKYVDYFTDEDKQTIINDVLSALPNGDEVRY